MFSPPENAVAPSYHDHIGDIPLLVENVSCVLTYLQISHVPASDPWAMSSEDPGQVRFDHGNVEAASVDGLNVREMRFERDGVS